MLLEETASSSSKLLCKANSSNSAQMIDCDRVMSAGTVRVAAFLVLVVCWSFAAMALPAVVTVEADDEQQTNKTSRE